MGKIAGRSANLRMGYFFQIHWDHSSPDTFLSKGSNAKLIFDPKQRLEVEFYSADRLPREISNPECLPFPQFEHYGTQRLENVVVCYVSNGPGNDHRDGLVYCSETAYHFIGQSLLETLRANGLTGLVVSKVIQLEDKHIGDWLREDEIVMIDGRCAPFPIRFIDPDDANRCEHCGSAPLMCPGCGDVKVNDWDFSALCWKCGATWLLASDAPESEKQEMRIQDADPFPDSFVDVARWDGSDFNAGMLVTRRVVNLFERLKCGSFRAEPVAVDVTGLTDEQWQRLEASRKPC